MFLITFLINLILLVALNRLLKAKKKKKWNLRNLRSTAPMKPRSIPPPCVHRGKQHQLPLELPHRPPPKKFQIKKKILFMKNS